MRITSRRAKPVPVYAGLTLGLVAISFAAVLIRLAESPVLVVSAYRMALAALVVGPFTLVRSPAAFSGQGRRELALTGASSVCLALHFALWIASLSHTSVASSVVLVTTSPILVSLASHFLFGERVSAPIVIGLVVAIVGAVVLGWGDLRGGSGELFGDFLAFAGAVAISGYLLLGRRVRDRMSLMPYISLVYAAAAIILLASMAVAGDSFVGYSAKTYLMLALVALIPQILGHSSLNWALGYVSATVVAIATMTEPVGATILAWLILREAPRPTSVLGGALILTGVYLALRRPLRQNID